MENLLHLGLSNAVASAVLALVAAAATFLIRRRPALVHGLWLLVLVKLFTPPLIRLPAPWPAETTPTVSENVATARPVEPQDAGRDEEPPVAVLRFDNEHAIPDEENGVGFLADPQPEAGLAETGPIPESPAVRSDPIYRVTTSRGWILVAIFVWAAGSAGWLVLAAVRILRFRRLLRFAESAPADLRQRVARLAKRLGLAHCPRVLLLPGRLAPMLWAAGGAARLLVPTGLLGHVRDDQLDTLLLHELAHLRRRDHWVRGLELLAMGLFWWNPVVWWARHELREAEEQCCDAWVVSVLSGSRRAYAEALVETLDFLSPAVPAQPLLSSGIGHVSDLKRRLTMILSGTTPRALTWRGALAVLGLACALPLFPAWVRAQEPGDEKKAIQIRPDLPGGEEAQAEGERAQAELQLLKAELAKKHAELKALEHKLQALQERTNNPGAAVTGSKQGQLILRVPEGAEYGRVYRSVVEAKAQGTPDVRVLVMGTEHSGFMPGTLYELVPGEKGSWILRPVQSGGRMTGQAQGGYGAVRVTRPGEGMTPLGINPGVPGAPPFREAELEKRLEMLMREVEKLRIEMRKPADPRQRPGRPDEQGKADPTRPTNDPRSKPDGNRFLREPEAIQGELERRIQVQEAALRVKEIAREQQDAETATLEARRFLEKARAVVVEPSPVIKEAEARVAEAQARLAEINRKLVILKMQADEAAKAAAKEYRR